MKFPALFEAADAIAAESQRKFLRALRAELLALSAAALVAQVPARELGGAGPIAALALFGVAFAIRISRVEQHAQREWYDARAAAESIKSASWQYAVGGEAYRVDDPDAEPRFQTDLRRYLGQLSHLDVPTGSPAQSGASTDMQALRRMPVADRAEAYLRDRVEDQLSWYSTSAGRNKHRARWWWAVTVAFEGAAIAVGLARVVAKFDIDWLGVLAAIAASLAAWQQAKRYTELSESYSVTSHEVGLIRSSLDRNASEPDWAQFVHDAEAAFSREHTLWLARRQGPLAG